MCADKLTPTKERVGHTPGPWRAEFGSHSGYDCMTAAWSINSVPQGGTVCVVDYGDYGSSHFDSTPNPQADANARLIAAAPDGLEAAELAYLALLRAGSSYRLRVQAELIALRNFIAKASGRSEQDVQDTAESMVAYE